MKKIAIITLNLLLVAFLVSSMEWLEREQAEIETITSEYKTTTQKLQTIAQINKWLEDLVLQSRAKESVSKISDENLITFFDAHKELYHLSIGRYISTDKNVKKIGLTYSVALSESETMAHLMGLEYQEGFLQFKEMKINANNLVGSFDVIQPQKGEENNASTH